MREAGTREFEGGAILAEYQNPAALGASTYARELRFGALRRRHYALAAGDRGRDDQFVIVSAR